MVHEGTFDAPLGPEASSLEAQIDTWRSHLQRRRTIGTRDAEELEDHLREQVATLVAQGLSDDEAFLVAVKRIGAIDALTREFAREHSDRLWKQLVLSGSGQAGAGEPSTPGGARLAWPSRRPPPSSSRRCSASSLARAARSTPSTSRSSRCPSSPPISP